MQPQYPLPIWFVQENLLLRTPNFHPEYSSLLKEHFCFLFLEPIVYYTRDNELVIQLQPSSIKLATWVLISSQRDEAPQHQPCVVPCPHMYAERLLPSPDSLCPFDHHEAFIASLSALEAVPTATLTRCGTGLLLAQSRGQQARLGGESIPLL